MLQYKKIDISEGMILIKQMHQNNVFFFIIGVSKTLVINSNQMFVINVMIY